MDDTQIQEIHLKIKTSNGIKYIHIKDIENSTVAICGSSDDFVTGQKCIDIKLFYDSCDVYTN